jgi:hypothetical protein
VLAAAALEAFPAVDDPVSADYPSSIFGTMTDDPALPLHDCPSQCVHLTNINTWTIYLSVECLQGCERPMLVQLAVPLALVTAENIIPIHACTPGHDPDSAADGNIASTTRTPIDNPNTDTAYIESSLDTAPACAIDW